MKKRAVNFKMPGATLPPQTVAGVPEPEKLDKVTETIGKWAAIFGTIGGIYYLGKFLNIHLPALSLHPYQIVILSFSCAFTWVYIFKWGSVKPFNCVTCLSGWFGLIFGYWAVGLWGVAYMPISMTVAAIYSEVRMRWL